MKDTLVTTDSELLVTVATKNHGGGGGLGGWGFWGLWGVGVGVGGGGGGFWFVGGGT